MATLGKDLHDTIIKLEEIRDTQDPPNPEILNQISTLSDQRIELIEAAINQATEKYKAAAEAMKEAAMAAKEAIDDLAKVADTIAKVAKAIGKINDLLGKIPI